MSSSTDVLQLKKEYLRARLREKFSNEGKRVLILGLGIQGGGAGIARFFCRLGFTVTVTDLRSKKDLAPSLRTLRGHKITYVLGEHRNEDIEKSDIIVKNPGIPKSSPYLRYAEKLGKTITNDADLFLSLVPRDRVIGVTGTKGKTTTTMLIGHLLGRRTLVVGTPGVSFFEYFSQAREPEWVVGEFSSFDLEYVRESPRYAVLTSLFSDHLNRYSSFAEYARAKMNLFRKQKKGDCTILARTPLVKKYLPKLASEQIWVTERTHAEYAPFASWRVARPSIAFAVDIALRTGVAPHDIKKRLSTFKAPHGRLEIVRTTSRDVFINDTTSTNPGAACYSLLRVCEEYGAQKKITVIAGGDDKALPARDIKAYADLLKRKRVKVILLQGPMTDILKTFLPRQTPEVASFPEALTHFHGGVLALIPGAASFNLFLNEFDRARQFISAVKAYRRGTA